MSQVKVGSSDAWLFLHGNELDLGYSACRWIKLDGQWFLTDERDISLD